MSNESSLRERKKAATRQAISDIATRLFIEHGFDAVTLADIAAEANVSRLTVSNYFPRKEDLFFDREGEPEALIAAALAARPKGQSIEDCLGDLFRQMLATDHPFVAFTPGVVRFWQTVRASENLLGRARQARDELAVTVAGMVAMALGSPEPSPELRLAAAMLATAWTVAFAEGLQQFERTGDARAARAAFTGLVERGLAGFAAVMAK